MPALGRLAPWRHVAVGGAIAAVGLAAFTGIIGEDHAERFDSKQVVVAPAGDDGVRVWEVVDVDFGNNRRHGYQRVVPNDFGTPVDVSATATDAPADLDVSSVGYETRIRVGDPGVTVTGQHRYTLTYTYPAARVSGGELALDVIGTDETFTTTRFEVVVTGWELADTTCNVGSFGDVGGCELVDDGAVYRVVFEPLEPGEGVTIGGRIVGRREVVTVEAPPPPSPRPDRRVPLGLATTALGAVTGAGTYAWARRRGRNEVYAGGAADAAFGVPTLPPPGAAAPPPPPTRLVADEDLADMATTEFVPPSGVDPWLGRVLLSERHDPDTVAAWLAGHAARDVLAVTRGEGDGAVSLARGSKFATAAEADRRTIDTMLGAGDEMRLGKYSKEFAAGWNEIAGRQRRFIVQSGFWKHPPRSVGAGVAAGGASLGLVVVVIAVLMAARARLQSISLFDSPLAAVALAVVVPGVVAFASYRRLLPARTAVGSALALRTESFRRFLAASEARHVEWAWKHGMLREYSAWAVALDTADAWEAAMRASAVPPAELSAAPLLLYHHHSALAGTRVAPSSGGRGGSGGFSGGSVGGGGGGGSSGSW